MTAACKCCSNSTLLHLVAAYAQHANNPSRLRCNRINHRFVSRRGQTNAGQLLLSVGVGLTGACGLHVGADCLNPQSCAALLLVALATLQMFH